MPNVLGRVFGLSNTLMLDLWRAVRRFDASGLGQSARPTRPSKKRAVVFADRLTDLVAEQERLRQSEATLRAAGDNLPDSVLYRFERDAAWNPRFLYISAGVENLTGVTVEEAMADARALHAQVLPESLPK